jgi:hypothetical protein
MCGTSPLWLLCHRKRICVTDRRLLTRQPFINLSGLQIYGNDGWEQAAYTKKVAWTGEMIATMAADVWGVQELWHGQALKEVFAASGIGGDYTLLVPPDLVGDHIACSGAVRTSILVGAPEWITDFPAQFTMRSGGNDPQTSEISVLVNTFSRPVLHFHVRPKKNSKPISVYVVHFKSKCPEEIYKESWYKADKPYFKKHYEALGGSLATVRRTAEATALRMILTDEMKENDNPVVVLGDCNDGQMSNTLNILTNQPNYLLGCTSMGGSDTALYSVGTLQELKSLRDVYYTHVYQHIRESLDHILVSQELYDHSKKRLWAMKEMVLANDHLNDEDHKTDGTSDHGVVKATFEYHPVK